MRKFAPLLLLLSGCRPVKTPSLPTASLAQWTGDGNPTLPVCSDSVQYQCKLSYTLTDITSGRVIANIPIGQLQYTINSISPDMYSLALNEQVAPGNVISMAVEAVAK